MLLQVGLRAADLERARRCWETLLQRSAVALFDPPGLLFFDLDGVRLLLDRGLPAGTVYLRVDDVDAAVGRAQEAGAVLESPPQELFRHEDDTLGPAGTTEWHASVRDPDGNLVGLVEQRRS